MHPHRRDGRVCSLNIQIEELLGIIFEETPGYTQGFLLAEIALLHFLSEHPGDIIPCHTGMAIGALDKYIIATEAHYLVLGNRFKPLVKRPSRYGRGNYVQPAHIYVYIREVLCQCSEFGGVGIATMEDVEFRLLVFQEKVREVGGVGVGYHIGIALLETGMDGDGKTVADGSSYNLMHKEIL